MSDRPNLINEILISQLLDSVPACSGKLVDYRLLREDKDYAVVAAKLIEPARKVIIKLAGPGARLASDFERSAAIVRIVQECSRVLTFDVLAVDVSYRVWPWRYFVTTALPGRHWSDIHPEKKGDELRALYTALGEAVGQLHAIHFPSCGEVALDGRVIAGTDCYAALVGRAQRRIANPAHAALFLALLQERRALFDDRLTGELCHEDLNPSNLLVTYREPGQLAVAMIDFESAWAGCAESDLARLEFWRGMMGDGFWEAYGEHSSISSGYPSRRPVYQLLWCLEYARPTARHLADTARVCAALDIPPVTFPQSL